MSTLDELFTLRLPDYWTPAEALAWVFRAKSATDSDVNRPPIPLQIGR